MFDIEYIAVPVDFSRASRTALAVAHSIAGKTTTVEPIHVVNRWPAFMEDVLFPYAPLGEDAAEVEAELVSAAAAALARFHELEEEPPVSYGELKETLTEEIRSRGAELVVMGASGESGAMPDVLGSVTERLIRSANRPTLAVRENGATKIGKILVALDLSEGSRRVLEFAVGLAQQTQAELETIHVVADPLANDHENVVATVVKFDARQVAPKVRDRVQALFDRLTRSLDTAYAEQRQVRELHSKRRVVIGDPGDAIVDHVQAIDADIVVVGTQRANRSATSYLGRVAGSVARRAPCHVAVVPVPPLARLSGDD